MTTTRLLSLITPLIAVTCADNVGYFIANDTSGTLTAGAVCNNAGGRLAIITSSEAFDEATSVASASGYYSVVVALHCSSKDASCADSASKWTWYDSQNDNQDLCDISTGGLSNLEYYEKWDQWNTRPEDGEYCVLLFENNFLIVICDSDNVDEVLIHRDNAALCQPLDSPLCDDSTSLSLSELAFIVLGILIGCAMLCCAVRIYRRMKATKAERDKHAKQEKSTQPSPSPKPFNMVYVDVESHKDSKEEAGRGEESDREPELNEIDEEPIEIITAEPAETTDAGHVPSTSLKCDRGYPLYVWHADQSDVRLSYICAHCKRGFKGVEYMYSCQIKRVYDKNGSNINYQGWREKCPHHEYPKDARDEFCVCMDCGRNI
eukprot:CAMPEP_0197049578 /NCGR_PEP_ID=MMETSP1384-20130603/24693_1 /TAXON_ID=29189 /ORGANISM="Ammonia sp." /LENGTH=376 /DNA_ID=CAMNT_0042481869 /DNA_START=42 /DNA_END=1172 /DNA_ORIENTATION=+